MRVATLAQHMSHLEMWAELAQADKQANRKDRESNSLRSKISLKSKMVFFSVLSLFLLSLFLLVSFCRVAPTVAKNLGAGIVGKSAPNYLDAQQQDII